ncbi:hypothetical protein O181_015434 [Austropuccinia psidii MF-1]|uniref:Uncharacterized protein n=1 Tax=Austropuccinia psidii MF-1 TaxID=1389203 RepID=A0A9Q3GQU6_9BASI|nr:hypothetical protein [Austropuccinia psidii MF-1]
MTIVHQSGNINKNADGLSRWDLENPPDNPAWVPWEEHHIEGICVTGIRKGYFNQAKESYKMDKKLSYLMQTLNERFPRPIIIFQPR